MTPKGSKYSFVSQEYSFVRFEKSHLPSKKYNVVLVHKETGREKRVPFGSSSHQQYKDKTGLNLYLHLNHLDTERRKRYRLRHRAEGPKFSSGWFSWRYLW